MQNTVTSNTGVFEPATLEPVVFRLDTVPVAQTIKTRTVAPGRKKLARTLLLKWDMIAIIALMLASAVYGVYAIFFLTGF